MGCPACPGAPPRGAPASPRGPTTPTRAAFSEHGACAFRASGCSRRRSAWARLRSCLRLPAALRMARGRVVRCAKRRSRAGAAPDTCFSFRAGVRAPAGEDARLETSTSSAAACRRTPAAFPLFLVAVATRRGMAALFGPNSARGHARRPGRARVSCLQSAPRERFRHGPGRLGGLSGRRPRARRTGNCRAGAALTQRHARG